MVQRKLPAAAEESPASSSSLTPSLPAGSKVVTKPRSPRPYSSSSLIVPESAPISSAATSALPDRNMLCRPNTLLLNAGPDGRSRSIFIWYGEIMCKCVLFLGKVIIEVDGIGLTVQLFLELVRSHPCHPAEWLYMEARRQLLHDDYWSTKKIVLRGPKVRAVQCTSHWSSLTGGHFKIL